MAGCVTLNESINLSGLHPLSASVNWKTCTRAVFQIVLHDADADGWGLGWSELSKPRQCLFFRQNFLELFLDMVNPQAGENSALFSNVFDLVNPCLVALLLTGSLETTVARNSVWATPVDLEVSKLQLFYSKGQVVRSGIFPGKCYSRSQIK